jgi:hypothetical protein
MRITHSLILCPLALVAGCATHAVDNNYGNAYHQVLEAQVYDTATLSTASGSRAIVGVDPDVANAAVEGMRKDAGDRSSVKNAGAVNIQGSGGSSGSGGNSGGGASGGSGGQ